LKNRTDARSSGVRVVVTGIGAVSTWGWSASELWDGLLSGRTGIAPARRFDVRGQRTEIVGEVPEPDAALIRAFPEWRHYSQADRFGVVAAKEAFRSAGAKRHPEESPDPELGVFFGGSTGGMAECEDVLRQLYAGTPVRWGRLEMHQLNCPTDVVARFFASAGAVQSISSACASGAMAIGAAVDAIRAGEVKAALAGGADSLCHLTYSGFNSLRAVDTGPCRPFRHGRAGMSLGEGAGVLYLETLESALARNVRPLAEILGSGTSCDAHHMTAPHPQGEGAALAMSCALEDAGLEPDDVDFVNAHGTGTPHNDVAESHALAAVFGQRTAHLPVTSTKACVGHLLGSSGAIEATATVQCLLAGQVHAVPGNEDETARELGLDLVVGSPRRLEEGPGRQVGLSTSFGFGGANAVLVLAGWPRETSP